MGQKGQKMLSLPLPGAYSCSDAWGYASTHWEPGFYKTVIKRPGTYTARNTHLSATASFPVFANGFQSWGKPRRHVGRKKNAKSIVTASGYPPNQIEKKTKEIFWLLYSFCIPLWNRWIFFILPIFKCLQRNCPVRRGKFREGSNTFLDLSGSSFLIRLPTSHFDFYWWPFVF